MLSELADSNPPADGFRGWQGTRGPKPSAVLIAESLDADADEVDISLNNLMRLGLVSAYTNIRVPQTGRLGDVVIKNADLSRAGIAGGGSMSLQVETTNSLANCYPFLTSFGLAFCSACVS